MMPHQPPRRYPRPHRVTVLVFLLTALCAGVLVWRAEQDRIQSERARVADLAGDQAHLVQRDIERSMSATYALAALVRQGNGEFPNFDAVARQMLPFYPGTAFEIAPGGVIRSVVPRAGNEGAIGVNMLNSQARSKESARAVQTRELTLAGPFKLAQGGLGAVGRLPVFLEGAQGQPTFWGFVAVLIRFPEALDSMQLSQLEKRGFNYDLWRIDPDTGQKQVIAASSAQPLNRPVERALQVPNATWTLSVAPIQGWSNLPLLAFQAGLGLLFALVMAFLTRLEVQARAHRQRLEALVVERTAQIEAREADLNRAQAIARVGSWVYDLNRGELHWSAETYRIFGVSPEVRPSYQDLLERIHPDDRETVEQAWQKALQGAPYDVEHRIVVDQKVRWVREQAERGPELNPDGTLRRYVGTAQDITERKQAEHELRRAKEAADQASRAKDEFLAKLSHELRTPLTPVLLATAQWEVQPEVLAAVGDDLAMVRRNLELEARLLDDLLDVSRILNGKMLLRRERVEMHGKITEALAIVAEDLRVKRLTVSLHLQATRSWMDGDPARVQQVLWNLLSNAIKFSPDDASLTVSTANDAQGQILVQVTDRGMGIAPEFLPRLFQPFEQDKRQIPHRYGGLGLGLTICKSVVEMHGGSITAQSPGLGQGATFTLRFPTVASPAAAETRCPPPLNGSPQGRRVLLVEDHPDTRKLLSRLIKGWGYEVRAAQSVASALAAAAEPFDLLVSDLGLPDGNGHDLMMQLSAKGPVKGIAVSGYGAEEDVRRSKEVGFAEHLTKPVNPAILLAAIRRTDGVTAP